VLGHSSLGTTQIYTHVQNQELKIEHRTKHPAELINQEGEDKK
jgi:site-specific recombinase XerD